MEAPFASSCLCALKERKVFRRELPLSFQIHLDVKRWLGTLSPFVQKLFEFRESSIDLFIPRQDLQPFRAEALAHAASVLFVPHLGGVIWKMLIRRSVADPGIRNRNAQVI
jgi:hypothetical protein